MATILALLILFSVCEWACTQQPNDFCNLVPCEYCFSQDISAACSVRCARCDPLFRSHSPDRLPTPPPVRTLKQTIQQQQKSTNLDRIPKYIRHPHPPDIRYWSTTPRPVWGHGYFGDEEDEPVKLRPVLAAAGGREDGPVSGTQHDILRWHHSQLRRTQQHSSGSKHVEQATTAASAEEHRQQHHRTPAPAARHRPAAHSHVQRVGVDEFGNPVNAGYGHLDSGEKRSRPPQPTSQHTSEREPPMLEIDGMRVAQPTPPQPQPTPSVAEWFANFPTQSVPDFDEDAWPAPTTSAPYSPPADSKQLADQVVRKCCEDNPAIDAGCYPICKLTTFTKDTIVDAAAAGSCAADNAQPVLDCLSQQASHTACCQFLAVPDRCLSFCTPSTREAQRVTDSQLQCLDYFDVYRDCFQQHITQGLDAILHDDQLSSQQKQLIIDDIINGTR